MNVTQTATPRVQHVWLRHGLIMGERHPNLAVSKAVSVASSHHAQHSQPVAVVVADAIAIPALVACV